MPLISEIPTSALALLRETKPAPRQRCEPLEPLVVTPAEAMNLLRTSRATLYELVNSGEVESFLRGRRRLITMASLKTYISRHLTDDAGQRLAGPSQRRADRLRRQATKATESPA